MFCFFPTCQVRVAGFYQNVLPLPPCSFSSSSPDLTCQLVSAVRLAGLQLSPCWIAFAVCWSPWGSSDFRRWHFMIHNSQFFRTAGHLFLWPILDSIQGLAASEKKYAYRRCCGNEGRLMMISRLTCGEQSWKISWMLMTISALQGPRTGFSCQVPSSFFIVLFF